MMDETFQTRVLSTLGTISNTLADVHAKVIEHDVTLRHHGRQLETMSEREETTGRHEVAELRDRLKRYSDRAAERKDKIRTGLVVAVSTVLLSSVATGLLQLILRH